MKNLFAGYAMKRWRAFAILVLFLTLVAVGLVLLRNHELDEATHAFKEGNGPAALERLKPLAYLGDKTAQMLTGLTYAYGWGGVEKDRDQAMYWFRRCGPFGVSEKTEDPAAQLALVVAKRYAEGGEGITPDQNESVKWLKFAADGGSKEAQAMLKHSNN